MEKLFDLDELHSDYRKKKIRNMFIVVLIVIFILLGLSALALRPHDSKANVDLTGSISPTDNSANHGQTVPTTAQQPSSDNASSVGQSSPSADYAPTYTYTPTTTPTISPSTSSITTPDPTKCAGIRAQMSAATADLDAQAAQLRAQIKSEQNPAQDQQQLISVVNQITAIDETYIPQLTANMCP